MDDEYKWAGVEDPKIMITTSRDPSSRLKMFAKVGIRTADEMLSYGHNQKIRETCRNFGCITVYDPFNLYFYVSNTKACG